MVSLADRLAELTKPVSALHDPEDDVHHESSAKLVEKDNEDDDQARASTSRSSLRNRNVPLLSEHSRRYAGKKVLRKNLKDADDGSDDTSGSDDIDEDVLEKLSSENRRSVADSGKVPLLSSESDSDHVSDDNDADSDSNDDNDSDGDGDDDFSSNSGSDRLSPGTAKQGSSDSVVRSFSSISINEELVRGKATVKQLSLWDSLLEARIKLQKLVLLINQFPQCDSWVTYVSHLSSDQSVSLQNVQQKLKNLLDSMVHLQTKLLLQNHDTKHVVTGRKDSKNATKKSARDDEITSEEDEEEVDAKEAEIRGVKRKLPMSEYPDFLAKRHQSFQSYRNGAIQKWNDKTRLVSSRIKDKQSGIFGQSILKQIEQILADKNRLLKRTQLQRTSLSVVGKHKTEQPAGNSGALGNSSVDGIDAKDEEENTKSYDPEIFNDEDFYHQQLRELIERKTADITDPIELSRQWLEIQKLRSKVKKKVDTKASKGRRVRFDVHKKLVNFMAPLDNCSFTEDSKNDLFSSLFGKQPERTITTT